MKYLLGSKQEFYNFLDSITEKDKIAIISHNDVDGIASAVFMTEILKNKKLKSSYTTFLKIDKNMLSKPLKKLKRKKISKIFILDLNAGDIDPEGFENLRKNFQVFLIDHHPIYEQTKNKGNIIKTESKNCVAYVIYDLGKEIINTKKWKWLLCASMIADISVKDNKNLKLVQNIYCDVKKDDFFDSRPGRIAKKITSALIYYKNKEKVFKIVLNKDLKKLEKAYKKINKEVQKHMKEYKNKAEYFPKKKIYFYQIEPKYNIASIITTRLALQERDKTFISFSDDKDYLKINARGQKSDVSTIIKKSIKNLPNATGGGHKRASGARIMKKDLKTFKKNVLKYT